MRVVVVGDHLVVAGALAEQLSQEGDMHAVALSTSSSNGPPDVAQHVPDVVVLATDHPEPELVRLLARGRQGRAVPVVVSTGCVDTAIAAEAVRAGATAWVTDEVSGVAAVRIVRAAAQRQSWLPPDMLADVLQRLARPAPVPGVGPLDLLTERETDVLRLMVEGLDRPSIAEELGLTANTVSSHVQHLMRKLGVHSRLQAVAVAHDAGMRPQVHP